MQSNLLMFELHTQSRMAHKRGQDGRTAPGNEKLLRPGSLGSSRQQQQLRIKNELGAE